MLYTGVLPPAGLLPACRCPSAYPRLKQSDNYTCVNSSNNDMKRLQVTYNDLDVLIDKNSKAYWLVPPGNITLQVELMDDYQVFSEIFYSELLLNSLYVFFFLIQKMETHIHTLSLESNKI